MNITLDLPPELENELSAEAARLGLSLAEYALRILSTGRTERIMPKTGAELVTYWQNEALIGTRLDTTGDPEYARQIRDQAERRPRE